MEIQYIQTVSVFLEAPEKETTSRRFSQILYYYFFLKRVNNFMLHNVKKAPKSPFLHV